MTLGGGGGIYCWASSPSITSCTISGNSADDGGGIYCYYESSPIITNCIMNGNSANEGGGIYCYKASPNIINCTVNQNGARLQAGGIYCGDSLIVITNCILWDNSQEALYIEIDSTAKVSYSDIQGGYVGEGNINTDPLFIDASRGDYYLRGGSPCIDAGTNEGAPDEDKNGVSRPQDGDNDGIAICDMGAYECYNVGPLVMRALPITH